MLDTSSLLLVTVYCATLYNQNVLQTFENFTVFYFMRPRRICDSLILCAVYIVRTYLLTTSQLLHSGQWSQEVKFALVWQIAQLVLPMLVPKPKVICNFLPVSLQSVDTIVNRFLRHIWVCCIFAFINLIDGLHEPEK